MAKYICSICGFVYNEAEGMPQAGIASGTSWEDLPPGWVCPICGAEKSEFEKQGESSPTRGEKPKPAADMPSDVGLSPRLSALAQIFPVAVKSSIRWKKRPCSNNGGYFKSAAALRKDRF